MGRAGRPVRFDHQGQAASESAVDLLGGMGVNKLVYLFERKNQDRTAPN